MPGGLAIRVTTGNGFNVLGASRADVDPSDTEMNVIKTAVIKVFDPTWLFEGEKELIQVGDAVHYIRRLYWPAEALKIVHGTYKQKALM